jgi:hypothetical protein
MNLKLNLKRTFLWPKLKTNPLTWIWTRRTRLGKKVVKPSAPDASDLPPIHEIPVIFDDLVSRIPEIKDVAGHVAGRKLRVATMCSGTESPLLALELIQKSVLEQHGINLDIEHVFSCEIEPFKQAYIERNFHPPILFRDVCELGDGEAYVKMFIYFANVLIILQPYCVRFIGTSAGRR